MHIHIDMDLDIPRHSIAQIDLSRNILQVHSKAWITLKVQQSADIAPSRIIVSLNKVRSCLRSKLLLDDRRIDMLLLQSFHQDLGMISCH